MKWRTVYLKVAYLLVIAASIIAAAGADWKWH